jgi:hypothetical protein
MSWSSEGRYRCHAESEKDAQPMEDEMLSLCFLGAIAGFAFVYMRDYRDAEDAIRGLDRSVCSAPWACTPSSSQVVLQEVLHEQE